MSPVGHSLMGLSFAAVALPWVRVRSRQIALAFAFVSIANLPDWPIPSWGHDRYDISHSIYVNLVLIALALSLWRAIPHFNSSVRFHCILLGVGAWLSHLALDSFYNHGHGIGIFWPFSDGKLNLSMPWFNTLDLTQSPISRHNLSVYLIEFAAYFPILLIAIVIGQMVKRLRTSSLLDRAG